MGGEFKTHGLDRVQTAVKQAVGELGATTDDTVEVVFNGDSAKTANIRSGKRGARLINSTLESPSGLTIVWTVSSTTISVTLNGNRTGLLLFELV